MTRLRAKAAAVVFALGLLGAAGCSDPGTAAADNAPAEAATQAASVTAKDAWVKSAESGMSAAFGSLVNGSDKDVRVVSATTDASPMVELHETVENGDGQMVMREKDGGFAIPAKSEYALQPGANHLMLMGISAPLKAGESVKLTVSFEDGSTLEFEAPVKDYTGANETYEHG